MVRMIPVGGISTVRLTGGSSMSNDVVGADRRTDDRAVHPTSPPHRSGAARAVARAAHLIRIPACRHEDVRAKRVEVDYRMRTRRGRRTTVVPGLPLMCRS